MEVQVNLWAVLAATASAMVVGTIWYSDAAFAKAWVKLAKIDIKNHPSIAKPLSITIVSCLVTAYVLAHVAYLSNRFFHDSFLWDSVATAFWLWLGFAAARLLSHDVFEGRPPKLTAITLGNDFVTIMLMGLVIGLIGA
jgi:hypothetical protein